MELKQYFERVSVPNRDEENQVSLRQLFEKIGGFPGRSQYGKDITVTAWVVLQHDRRDSEFQKEGLRLMYECRNQDKNENQVELVYFYYLTDSITMVLHGYQFLGLSIMVTI